MIQKLFEAWQEPNNRHFVLTGGRNAQCAYNLFQHYAPFAWVGRRINFYLSDERCVSLDDPHSNHEMILTHLFSRTTPAGTTLYAMETETPDRDASAARYAACLPDRIDVLLLSVGEDGHIASLFPHSAALKETERLVVPVVGPKPPHQRLTITPPVIASAKHVFVLALGEAKRSVYEEALRDPADIDSIPARLVLDKTWIFSLD